MIRKNNLLAIAVMGILSLLVACGTTTATTATDTDSDGVADSTDNCDNDANADQADADGDGTGDACEASGGTFTLSSDDMPSGSEIPEDPYALSNALGCPGSTGSNTSPQLEWSGVPSDALSLAISMIDLDCTSDCGLAGDDPFIHWIVYDIPITVTSLDRGASDSLPTGAVNGGNEFMDAMIPNYGGPCPPTGEAHTYEFKIWALSDAQLDDDEEGVDTGSAATLLESFGNKVVTNGTASFQREFTGP